jgi:hypothetical protein
MEEFENKGREEIFSQAVRAGKRTYFFDVKATRAGDYYLTITESKRRFNNNQGKYYYEKHKVFLYKEDFEKFKKGLENSVTFIQTGERPVEEEETTTTPPEANATDKVETKQVEENTEKKDFTDVSFEDLGSDKME